MKLQIHANIDVRCVQFLRRKLQQFDTSNLEYFRLYDRTGKTATAGTWGRCTFPNRQKQLGYRIRCSVSIITSEFPHVVKWAIGTKRLDQERWEWLWRQDRFETKEEAFVWVAGHEAFHWLRHSRQIPGKNYETQANRYGFGWLDEWRHFMAEGANNAAGSSDAPARKVRIDHRGRPLGCSSWVPSLECVKPAIQRELEVL